MISQEQAEYLAKAAVTLATACKGAAEKLNRTRALIRTHAARDEVDEVVTSLRAALAAAQVEVR